MFLFYFTYAVIIVTVLLIHLYSHVFLLLFFVPFVLFKVAKDAVVSWVLSFQAHPGAKTDLNDGIYANALVGSIWSPKFDF